MVDMTVREDRRLDLPHIDAQAWRIVIDRVAGWPGIEK
jgi:hypothetical protein